MPNMGARSGRAGTLDGGICPLGMWQTVIWLAMLAGCSGLTVPENDAPSSRPKIERDTVAIRVVPNWVVGRICGLADQPPPGRTEVGNYIENRRDDLLRQLLQDPEPAAQVYGLIGLKQLGLLPEDLFEARISSISDRVEVCHSCIFTSASAAEAVGYY